MRPTGEEIGSLEILTPASERASGMGYWKDFDDDVWMDGERPAHDTRYM
jgi:hypothetical protein